MGAARLGASSCALPEAPPMSTASTATTATPATPATPGTPASQAAAARGAKLSIDQMLRLMQVEVDKAQAHAYPISCILIGLDGFENAEDEPRKKKVMPAVFHLLKRVTFDRGVQGLGFWSEKVVLAVFPHVAPAAVAKVGSDLIESVRGVAVPGLEGGRTITLSGGVAHNQHSGPMSFEVLIREAETGYSMARQSGGDRFVQWLEVESELDRLREELEEQMREVERRGELFAQEQDELAEKRSREFVKRIKAVFARESATEAVVRLEKEMIGLALSQIEEWRDGTLARELTESKKLVDNLERRVRKLSDLLNVTETELKRVAAMKNVDTGIASIYSSVQGIGSDDANAEVKKELMKSIFEANLALLGRDASEQ
jgi:GGDEF domain-containing protein